MLDMTGQIGTTLLAIR